MADGLEDALAPLFHVEPKNDSLEQSNMDSRFRGNDRQPGSVDVLDNKTGDDWIIA